MNLSTNAAAWLTALLAAQWLIAGCGDADTPPTDTSAQDSSVAVTDSGATDTSEPTTSPDTTSATDADTTITDTAGGDDADTTVADTASGDDADAVEQDSHLTTTDSGVSDTTREDTTSEDATSAEDADTSEPTTIPDTTSVTDADTTGSDTTDPPLECAAGTADCDDDGETCETDTTSSVLHCGGCDAPCAPHPAITRCVDSLCEVVGCAEGYCDDNGEPGDGCEAACTCGDGVVNGDDECDDGDVDAGDGCSDSCGVEDGWRCDGAAPSTCAEVCGDGLIVGDEECEDGNTVGGDGCSDSCFFEAVCGDGVVEPGETCDDGDIVDGDGCDVRCMIEAGSACGDAVDLNDPGNVVWDGASFTYEGTTEGAASLISFPPCQPYAADNPTVVHKYTASRPMMMTIRTSGALSDTVLWGYFDCLDESDDAPVCSDDFPGLGEQSQIEVYVPAGATFYSLVTSPAGVGTYDLVVTPRAASCGDGVPEANEQCDDTDTDDGDGCSASCVVEVGYVCEGQPSECRETVCGDSVVEGAELCDDGNTEDDDGCLGDCSMVESGFECVPGVCFAEGAGDVCGTPIALNMSGTFAASTTGRMDDYGDYSAVCPGAATNSTGVGPDTVFSVDVADGWLLEAALVSPHDLALALVGSGSDGCQSIDATTCYDVADRFSGNATESTSYFNASGTTETVFIIADGYGGDNGPFELTVATRSPECGDGAIDGYELCDDMNTGGGDGCSAMCEVEPEYACDGEPSICIRSVCGNGFIEEGEDCDDGGTDGGDGCDVDCAVEPTARCYGEPSRCYFQVGDTCASATNVGAGTYYGDTSDPTYGDTYDTDVCPGAFLIDYDGPDMAYEVLVPSGQTLVVSMVSPADLAVFIVVSGDECATLDAATCVAGDDDSVAGGQEDATYTNSSGSARTAHVIVDGFRPSAMGVFSLIIDLR